MLHYQLKTHFWAKRTKLENKPKINRLCENCLPHKEDQFIPWLAIFGLVFNIIYCVSTLPHSFCFFHVFQEVFVFRILSKTSAVLKLEPIIVLNGQKINLSSTICFSENKAYSEYIKNWKTFCCSVKLIKSQHISRLVIRNYTSCIVLLSNANGINCWCTKTKPHSKHQSTKRKMEGLKSDLKNIRLK